MAVYYKGQCTLQLCTLAAPSCALPPRLLLCLLHAAYMPVATDQPWLNSTSVVVLEWQQFCGRSHTHDKYVVV